MLNNINSNYKTYIKPAINIKTDQYLVFSEVDNYVTCFEKIESGDVVKNVLVLEDDYYSEYTDYKVETLIGDELEFHYNEYVKNINYESDSNS